MAGMATVGGFLPPTAELDAAERRLYVERVKATRPSGNLLNDLKLWSAVAHAQRKFDGPWDLRHVHMDGEDVYTLAFRDVLGFGSFAAAVLCADISRPEAPLVVVKLQEPDDAFYVELGIFSMVRVLHSLRICPFLNPPLRGTLTDVPPPTTENPRAAADDGYEGTWGELYYASFERAAEGGAESPDEGGDDGAATRALDAWMEHRLQSIRRGATLRAPVLGVIMQPFAEFGTLNEWWTGVVNRSFDGSTDRAVAGTRWTFAALALGVVGMHSIALLHMDIKPANVGVMLTRNIESYVTECTLYPESRAEKMGARFALDARDWAGMKGERYVLRIFDYGLARSHVKGWKHAVGRGGTITTRAPEMSYGLYTRSIPPPDDLFTNPDGPAAAAWIAEMGTARRVDPEATVTTDAWSVAATIVAMLRGQSHPWRYDDETPPPPVLRLIAGRLGVADVYARNAHYLVDALGVAHCRSAGNIDRMPMLALAAQAYETAIPREARHDGGRLWTDGNVVDILGDDGMRLLRLLLDMDPRRRMHLDEALLREPYFAPIRTAVPRKAVSRSEPPAPGSWQLNMATAYRRVVHTLSRLNVAMETKKRGLASSGDERWMTLLGRVVAVSRARVPEAYMGAAASPEAAVAPTWSESVLVNAANVELVTDVASELANASRAAEDGEVAGGDEGGRLAI